MTRGILFFILVAFIFSVNDIQGQSLRNRLLNKILDDNIEAQAKKDSIRAVEAGEEPDKHPNKSMNDVYMDAFGLTGNVDYDQSYAFTGYIQMEILEYNKKGEVEGTTIYDSYTNKESMNYAMVFTNEGSTSTIIFDSENSAMLILANSDGEKTGMAMSIDGQTLEDAADEAEEDYEDIDYSAYAQYKTGKTKSILGYSCDEYLMEDENNETRMWVSEKLKGEMRKEVLNNQQTFGAIFYHAYYMNGMVLEYDFLDKQDGDRSVMKVKDIDLNRKHSVSTGGYQVISFKQPAADESEE